MIFNCNKATQITNGTALFVHIGAVRHIYNPLYISTKPVKINLSQEQMEEVKLLSQRNKRDLSEVEKKYISAKFDRVITDSTTFSLLYSFIINNTKFYTDSRHQNNDPGADSYNIHINGQVYCIYYKNKNDFFDKLEYYLNKNKADNKVIKELSYLKR